MTTPPVPPMVCPVCGRTGYMTSIGRRVAGDTAAALTAYSCRGGHRWSHEVRPVQEERQG